MKAIRATSTARGYDKEWFKARARHIRTHPFCLLCLREGKQVASKHVDHLKSIRFSPGLRLDPTNFVSLCEHHHNLITGSIDSLNISGATDETGFPLDPQHPWNQASQTDMVTVVNVPRKKIAAPPEVAAKLKRQVYYGGRK